MKIYFNFLEKKLCAAIATAETPCLRKLLLTNYFTVASMTKMQFKQNTSEKLDYRYCCISHLTHRNESFSRLNQKVGQNRKNRAISARRKVHLFQNQERFLFFCNRQGGGVDPRPPPLHTPLGPIFLDLAPGEHRNIAAVASRCRHCADLTSLEIKPQTFRTDSLCA